MSNTSSSMSTISSKLMLKAYLEETLKLEKSRKEKKAEGARLSAHDKLSIRNNDEMKVRVIDSIFQSLANLIYFFEFLNKHPQLIDKFVNDIEDLLGVRLNSLEMSEKDRKYQHFKRLIMAILGYHGYENYTDNKFNYQRRCMNITLQASAQKIEAFNNMENRGPQMREAIKQHMLNTRMCGNYFDNVTTGREKRNARRVIEV